MRERRDVTPRHGSPGPADSGPAGGALRSVWRCLPVLLALASPGVAAAWPVDVTVDLRPGDERFRRLSALEWVEVEDPSVVTAEVLESGELLLTGKSPGRTLVLLYAEGRFAVWRVRVGPTVGPPWKEALEQGVAAARKACPGLEAELAPESPSLSATVADERCRRALLTLFEADGFVARELSLTFELAALQAQLASLQAGIASVTKERVEARYLGAGLVLEGRLPAREHRRVLWEVFRRTVGRPAVDDRIEVADASGADGGTR